MSEDPKMGRVIRLDPSRFKGQSAGQVDAKDLIETLAAVVQANIEPRIAAAIAPLEAEIQRLRTSLNEVAAQVERVRLGDANDAGLVITDDPKAAIDLVNAKVANEERYPYSTVDIASKIPGSPSTSRVATVIVELGLKGNPTYWCEMKVGSTSFNRYAKPGLERVLEAFRDPRKHLREDGPAFRTVMNFLEGS